MQNEMAMLIIELYHQDKKLVRIVHEKISAHPNKHMKYLYYLANDICAITINEGYKIVRITLSYFVDHVEHSKTIWRA